MLISRCRHFGNSLFFVAISDHPVIMFVTEFASFIYYGSNCKNARIKMPTSVPSLQQDGGHGFIRNRHFDRIS